MRRIDVRGRTPAGFHKISCCVWPSWVEGKVPVVCVHGLLRNARDFDKLASKLSERNEVICPDMPGRGLSDNLADPMLYTLDQYVTDMTSVMGLARARQIDWVGTSMGGLLGMMIAGMEGNPIRKLVLNDVGPVLPQAALRAIGEYMDKTPEQFESEREIEELLRRNYAAWGTLRDDEWATMARHSQRRDAAGRLTIGYDRAISMAFKGAGSDINLWETYDRIKCPVLLLRGANSTLLTSEIAQEMTRRGPYARLVEIEGCGHAPSLMTDGQIKLVADFING